MSLIELSLIGVALLACLYSSYTDIRHRKIGNRITYSLVLLGLVSQALFTYLGIITIAQTLWLFVGGLAIAFLMYYLGIWSPGDSKLFWAVSVALPPTLYTAGFWRYPPFVISVNTFVPYFLVMAVYILAKTSVAQKIQVLRDTLSPTFLLRFVLSLMAFGGLSTLLNRFLPFNLDYFSTIILFIVLFAIFDRLVDKEKQLYFLAPFAVVSLALAWDNWQYFLGVMAMVGLHFNWE